MVLVISHFAMQNEIKSILDFMKLKVIDINVTGVFITAQTFAKNCIKIKNLEIL